MTKKNIQTSKQKDRAEKAARRTLSPIAETELQQVAGGVLKSRHDTA